MNIFDAVVTGLVILAMVLGFMSGLLRSLATMLGYVIAVPVAVAITPRLMPFVAGQTRNFAGLRLARALRGDDRRSASCSALCSVRRLANSPVRKM